MNLFAKIDLDISKCNIKDNTRYMISIGDIEVIYKGDSMKIISYYENFEIVGDMTIKINKYNLYYIDKNKKILVNNNDINEYDNINIPIKVLEEDENGSFICISDNTPYIIKYIYFISDSKKQWDKLFILNDRPCFILNTTIINFQDRY